MGASKPGVDGNLLVLMSQDRWIEIQDVVDGQKRKHLDSEVG
jgi:hypothetical protein